MNAIERIDQETLSSKELPEIRPGDKVRVSVEIQEGGRSRIQDFEGIVIAYNRAGVSSTITVRKVSFGVGVERVFPLYTPTVKEIKILSHGRVRRAKLYYLRGLSGKAARIKERVDFAKIAEQREAKAGQRAERKKAKVSTKQTRAQEREQAMKAAEAKKQEKRKARADKPKKSKGKKKGEE